MENNDKIIEQGGFVQHSGNKLPDVVMQLPKLFFYDTAQWAQAINEAKRWDWTRRTRLYDLYDSIMLDTHLYGVMRSREVAISQLPVEFVDKNGNPVDDVNDQIKSPWFRSFLKSLLQVQAFGFAAYQFYRDEEGDIQFTNIDKRHVQPHTKQILRMSNDLSGIPLDAFDNTLFLGDADNIGFLATACPWVLYKRQSMADWAQFSQVFGMPIREYTYSAGDEKTRQMLISDAMEQGANAVYIHPDASGMKLVESGNKSGSAELYKSLRDTCNEEISLLVLGNTLTSTSAAHGTQALGSVHAEQQDAIGQDDRSYVLDVLNYYMTDIFSNLGINTKDGEFIFHKDSAQLTGNDVHAQLSAVVQLKSQGLPISDDYLYKTFGIEKPEDYERMKKDLEEKMAEMQNNSGSPTQFSHASPTTNRALGFFAMARHQTPGEENLDW